MGRPKAEALLTPKGDYEDAWYAALASANGIALNAFPRDAVYQRLIQVRYRIGDPALSDLEIVKPFQENELWIIRKKT